MIKMAIKIKRKNKMSEAPTEAKPGQALATADEASALP